ncbi:leucine-rich repeat-containing protein 71 isoform X2 [Gymnodraco acuticeps]|uniref:Leucine-rich repeat-containing protein 71 isoform X2 n=1 Tax=Gymnodraco acuticeps TaxID=8218 RepID=A0A6P8TQ33_GYMAC|nr:leucine-rich repeat-containing protein 71 isoform X2 [Gymnodraco acuticeps]
MSRKRQKEKPDKANAEDEKTTGATPIEKLPTQTFDEYQCSGHVEVDFHCLCTLLDMKDIPAVSTKPPSSPTDTEGGDKEDSQLESNAEPCWSKPCLQVELEEEDPLRAKYLKVSGWKVDERIARVLQKMLLSLSKLQSLHFWQAGLTDPMVISLVNTISLCSNLRDVTLEGNHLPEQSYHLLLCEDSVLTHLSLRNNRIGDEGARLIGSALSTTRSANKNLVSLNLAFNAIGDAGATHIAQGLRFNRALLVLSLSNNQIGDSGAAHLAEILVEFPLTHEEVVDRRKMLLERTQTSCEQPAEQLPLVASSLSKGKKKEASKKEDKASHKKSSDAKVSQSKGAKQSGKEKQLAAQEDKSNTALNKQQQVECEEVENPLLDQSVQHRDGEIILPGNTTLSSLNLAGNRITEKSLPLFLKSLEKQGEGGGLLRLCLQRNRFPADCECYVKIKELMTLTA